MGQYSLKHCAISPDPVSFIFFIVLFHFIFQSGFSIPPFSHSFASYHPPHLPPSLPPVHSSSWVRAPVRSQHSLAHSVGAGPRSSPCIKTKHVILSLGMSSNKPAHVPDYITQTLWLTKYLQFGDMRQVSVINYFSHFSPKKVCLYMYI